MRATLSLLWLAPGLLALSGACTPTETTGSTTGTVTTLQATSVSVDPGSFLNGVPCGNRPGEMQSYVATVTDLGPAPPPGGDLAGPPYPITLPSSPPTSCSQSVYFQYVTVGNLYEAVIDGYEEPTSSLVPACGVAGPATPCTSDSQCAPVDGCQGRCAITKLQVRDDDKVQACIAAGTSSVTCQQNFTTSKPEFELQACDTALPSLPSGSEFLKTCSCQYEIVTGDRHMYSKKTGQAVTPRWTTPPTHPCGSFSPALAQDFATTPIGDCGPLQDNGSSASTGIEVDPRATLTGTTFGCTTDATPGTVTTFDVTPSDASMTPVTGIPCSQKNGITFLQGLTPDTQYTFTITANLSVAGNAPTAACRAVASVGVTVLAVCDPLLQKP